jgi:hypothetical protein
MRLSIKRLGLRMSIELMGGGNLRLGANWRLGGLRLSSGVWLGGMLRLRNRLGIDLRLRGGGTLGSWSLGNDLRS